jgi:DNA-binding CsgD family transcriptional regulator
VIRRTQLTQATLLRLIDLTYAAAVDTRLWPDVLDCLVETLGGTGAALLQHDITSQGTATLAQFARVDPEALKLYQEHYYLVDPWARSSQVKHLAIPGSVTADAALLPRNELKLTEFYPYMVHFGLSRMINATLTRDTSSFASISIYRAESDREFSSSESRFLTALAPHIARALQVHRQLERGRHHMAAVVEGLDALPCGALLVDADARVITMNRLATDILARAEGLSVKDSTLCGPDPVVTKRLRELCAGASLRETLNRRGGALSIGRLSSSPLQVLVSPVAWVEPFGVCDERAVAFVFISERERDRRPDEALLRLFFGLTATEAQICASLAVGMSPEDIADERRYTRETVRWYSKQLLHKTGCRNRGELVRLISRTLPSLGSVR